MKKKTIGVIDFDTKGNVVRFYMGDINKDYWGDDWDDRPYEHNAGKVYEEYIDHYIDIAFPYSCTVLEPRDDWHYNGNSPWSKEDMKNRKCPCIIIVPEDKDRWNDDTFGDYMSDESCVRIYFGDDLSVLDDCETLNIVKKVTNNTIVL